MPARNIHNLLRHLIDLFPTMVSSKSSISRCVGALLSLASFPSTVQTFQPTSLAASPLRQRSTSLQSTRTLSTSANAVSTRQTFIIDGGELQSFLLHNNGPSSASALRGSAADLLKRRNAQQAGCLKLVTGTTDEAGGRVVGVEKSESDETNEESQYDTVSLGNNVQVYKHTLASIPKGVSDNDAMSTAAAALVGIHCAIPKVEEVGGSDDEVFYSGKVS